MAVASSLNTAIKLALGLGGGARPHNRCHCFLNVSVTGEHISVCFNFSTNCCKPGTQRCLLLVEEKRKHFSEWPLLTCYLEHCIHYLLDYCTTEWNTEMLFQKERKAWLIRVSRSCDENLMCASVALRFFLFFFFFLSLCLTSIWCDNFFTLTLNRL